MSGPKPAEISLTDIEREGLEKLVNRHGTSQQIAVRARVILLAGAGKNNAEIARELKLSEDTPRLPSRGQTGRGGAVAG